ncbi:MAG: LacI family transcriptional regulator [Promicromonosporaceae bacterium]|nr:LacI family transcriptional regulator [Promicromonosporaceae bacterium]
MNTRNPTLDDVAREADVSRSTASRAINGGDKVSPEAQQAVDAAVKMLGYTPNRAARSLVTRRTDSIALVAPEPSAKELTDPFLPGLVRGVADGIVGTNLQLVVLLNGDAEVSARAARYLRAGHVDGAVVASHREGHLIEEALDRTGIPAVAIGRPFSDQPRHYVDLDNYAGARMATQHLLDQGCRRIGTITGSLALSSGGDRLLGWRDTLIEAGLPADAIAYSDFTAAGGATAAAELLAIHDLDGLFVASDVMAEGALRVLHSHGLRVPEDLRLVGFDNLGLSAHTTPPMTTVSNPIVESAKLATSILLELLAGKASPFEPRIIAPKLIVRDTA